MGNMPITADHTGGPAEPALPEQSITAPQTAPAASLEMVTPPTVGTAEPETPTDELPELSYPPETPALPEAVHAGAIIGPDGGEQFRILGERGVSFACRRYEASRVEDDTRVWLDEASTPESMDVLERRKTMLTTVASRFFPRLLGTFTDHERTYLVTEAVPAGTPLLSDVLATDPPSFLHRLTFITQVASALKQLHAQGNVHLGIRPDVVALTRPVKIIDMVYTTSIGTPLSQSYAHPGYSAPELVAGHPADVRADIYSVGALLYTAATGHVLPEAGAPQALFFPGTPRPGVPQILTRCLGRPETRYASMDDLHAALLRLARRDTPPVRHAITGRTEIGLESGRTTNQDALVSLSSTLISEAATEQWSVVVVADGMGGMAAGDVASDRAVHAVVKEAATQFASHPLPTMDEQVQWVRDWMHEANEQVCAAMEQQQARGGCTLVCACVVGQRLTIAHVGDCRIYHIRGAITRLLTRDHSVAMALVLQGEATLSEIRGHPKRSQVTRSLGERHPLQGYQIDTLQQMTGAPTMELEPGDVLLLCSDGLWELVEDEEIGAMVGEHHGDLDLAAHVLINLAMERGGPDNSTALLLRIDRSPANEQG